MRLCQIVEAEVDHKTGEVHRWVDRDKLLRKYAGDESVFISFSDINKLGLNPSSKFDTPVGIYAYPIGYVLSRSRDESDSTSRFYGSFDVPFAGDRNFAIVFRVKDLSKCWEVHGKQDVAAREGVADIIRGWMEIISREVKIVDDDGKQIDSCEDDWIDRCYELIDRNLRWVADDVELPGFTEADRLAEAIGLDNSQLNAVKFLTVAYNVIHRNWTINSRDDLLWRLCRTVGHFVSRNPAVGWSKVLLKLGYVGVIDNGNGIIHPYEPIQAVFFRLADLDHLESIRNTFDPGKGNARWSERKDRSIEAMNIRSGEIPYRVKVMAGNPFGLPSGHSAEPRLTEQFMRYIAHSNELVMRFKEGDKGDFNSANVVSWLANQFDKYREDLAIFKHNAPESYAVLRPRLLTNVKAYKNIFYAHGVEEYRQMKSVVAAFERLLRSI